MTLNRIMSIFGSTINNLQLCQCVRDIETELGSPYTNKALERVIMHTISGCRVPSLALQESYGPRTLNEILDESLAQDGRLAVAASETEVA